MTLFRDFFDIFTPFSTRQKKLLLWRNGAVYIKYIVPENLGRKHAQYHGADVENKWSFVKIPVLCCALYRSAKSIFKPSYGVSYPIGSVSGILCLFAAQNVGFAGGISVNSAGIDVHLKGDLRL